MVLALGVAVIRLSMSGGRAIMDRVSEKMLSEFSKEREISNLPEDKRFEHFVSFITIGRHYTEHFDTSDVLVGEAPGIDAVGIIVNGNLITDSDELEELEKANELDVTFVFVQADRGSSFDAAKIGSFGFAVRDFFSSTPTLPQNDQIRDAAEIASLIYDQSTKFKRGNPACRLYYATTGTWTGDAMLNGRRQGVVDDLRAANTFRDVTFTPLGANEVQKLYRQTKNAIEREFVFANRVTAPDVPGVSQAYLGFLPVRELMKIITEESGEIINSLFYSNPRDFQGYNDVNDEIMGTLSSDAKSQFVLMNNGITIIARDVRPTEDKFVIEDFQIVNGCQTSNILFEHADKAVDVTVPVRLIGTQDEIVINRIIRGTNRQTQVTEDQFFALQEFPKQLEEFFKSYPPQHKIYYERRSRQFERLQDIEKTRIITQPNVIRAFAAMFLEEPHRTTRNYSALKAKVGTEIFNKSHKMEPYYTAAFALYKLEYLFRNGKLESKYKPARFHILLAARLLGNPAPLPKFMNSREMEDFCKSLQGVLWNASKCDELMLQSAEAVKKAVRGNFNRDSVRTDATTKNVIARCQRQVQ